MSTVVTMYHPNGAQGAGTLHLQNGHTVTVDASGHATVPSTEVPAMLAAGWSIPVSGGSTVP